MIRALGLVGALLLSLGVSGCAPAKPKLPTEVTVSFRYSHFEPATISIPAGVPVTFTLQNNDPIEHEWIVGPPALHAIHRTGTEAFHEGKPDEVTVPAYSSKQTTITFNNSGMMTYICHLPGHEEYGMTGQLEIAPRTAGSG